MGITKNHLYSGVVHACPSVLESSATATFQNLFRIVLSPQLHHQQASALGLLDSHKQGNTETTSIGFGF